MFASLTSLFHNRDFGLERRNSYQAVTMEHSVKRKPIDARHLRGFSETIGFIVQRGQNWTHLHESFSGSRTFPLADKLSCDHLALVKYWDEYMFIRLVFLVLEWHFKCYWFCFSNEYVSIHGKDNNNYVATKQERSGCPWWFTWCWRGFRKF